MAIMHTQMIGLVKSPLDIVKDENDEKICCAFTLLVKEKNRKIPYTVYISDKDLIKKCEDEIDMGSTVLAIGIIEINFHDILQLDAPNGRKISYPVITSNMAIVCNKICVIYSRNDKDQLFVRKEAVSIPLPIKHEKEEHSFNPDDELPF